jgi:hypothetical protein
MIKHSEDWLPRREQDLIDLQAKWKEWLGNSAKQQAYGWDAADCADVAAKIDAFGAARAAYIDTNSGGNLDVKDAAKAASEEAMRDFANTDVRHNRRMGAEEKAFLGVRERDKNPSPIPLPSSRAVITDLRAQGGFVVGGRFHDENTPNSHAVLRGCNGMLINFAVSDEKITDYDKLTLTRLVTSSPWSLPRGPDAEGKFFTCAPRWQSTKGGALGPWGEIQSVVIA